MITFIKKYYMPADYFLWCGPHTKGEKLQLYQFWLGARDASYKTKDLKKNWQSAVKHQCKDAVIISWKLSSNNRIEWTLQRNCSVSFPWVFRFLFPSLVLFQYITHGKCRLECLELFKVLCFFARISTRSFDELWMEESTSGICC